MSRLIRGRRPEGDDGAIAVLAAALAVALFGLGAIVVDLGMMRVTRAEAQDAVDAASLAGAGALYDEPDSTPHFDKAVSAVMSSAQANGTPQADWTSCAAPLPGWSEMGSGTSCITFDSASSPRRVRVVLPSRRVNAAFGGVLGYSGSDVSATAQAQARDRSMQDCALCVSGLLGVSGSVGADGDGSIIAGSGDVTSGGSITLTQDAVDNGAGLGFESWPPSPAPPSPRYSPQPLQAAPQDPFAGAFATPALPPRRARTFTCGDGATVRGGVAYRSITVTGDCRASGTVVVVGTLRIASGGRLSGTSSTLYFTCRTGRRAVACGSGRPGQGSLTVDAGGQLDLTGGNVAGTWPVSVLYDPGDTGALTIAGDASTGSVYRPAGSAATVGPGARLEADGLVSLTALDVATDGAVSVTATGLDSRTGPFRVALAR